MLFDEGVTRSHWSSVTRFAGDVFNHPSTQCCRHAPVTKRPASCQCCSCLTDTTFLPSPPPCLLQLPFINRTLDNKPIRELLLEYKADVDEGFEDAVEDVRMETEWNYYGGAFVAVLPGCLVC